MSIRQDVIDRFARELYPGKPYAEEWAEVCERAGYKCEYCDKDMHDSLDNYCLKENDHINPKGAEDVDNYALSCRVCNMLKRNWNPADEVGEGACRDKLIQAVRRELKKRRGRKYEEYLKYQQIVGYPSSHEQCGCCE